MREIRKRADKFGNDSADDVTVLDMIERFAVQELAEVIKDITSEAELYKIKNNPHDFSYLVGLEKCIDLIKERLV